METGSCGRELKLNPYMPTTKLTIKPYVIWVYLGAFVSYLIVKSLLRPWVLSHDAWIGFDVFVLSYPNFVEAIMGLTQAYGMLLWARHQGWAWLGLVSARALLWLSVVLTSLYVLTQEFKLHNLGGNNIHDPYDAIASVAGVAILTFVFSRFGLAGNDS